LIQTTLKVTRVDAAAAFFGEHNVPRRALSMGVGTILGARRIYLLAWGEDKAEIVARAAEGPPDASVPATWLQRHKDARFVLDEPAAAALARRRAPWTLGNVDWAAAGPRCVLFSVLCCMLVCQQTNLAVLH
jgi:glucosamine-6-phosphate deaminase